MLNKNKCASCKYSSKINDYDFCCVYILIKKQMRGCYGDGDCDKYEKLTNKRRPQISLEGGFIYYD